MRYFVFLLIVMLLAGCSQNLTDNVSQIDDVTSTVDVVSEPEEIELTVGTGLNPSKLTKLHYSKRLFVDGVSIEHSLLYIPLAISGDIIYIPVNSDFLKLLGISAKYDNNTLLITENSTPLGSESIEYRDQTNFDKFESIQYLNNVVHFNKENIILENNMLLIDGEVYLPVEDDLIDILDKSFYKDTDYPSYDQTTCYMFYNSGGIKKVGSENRVQRAFETEDTNENNLADIHFDTLNYGYLTYVNDKDISKYAFIYYLPPALKNSSDIRTVVVGNGFSDHTSYFHLASVMRDKRVELIEYCNKHNYALVSFIIPGQAQYMKEEFTLTVANADDPLSRPDLEMKKIINAFLDKLNSNGLDMHDKVFYTGFSNGGLQSQVFPLLHPDIIEATSIGAAGIFTFPLAEVNGNPLNYQMGIANIDDVTDISFSLDSYLSVEHHIFEGEDDTREINDPIGLHGSKAAFYKSHFGDTRIDRVIAFTDVLNELGGKATYTIYEGVGHNWTPDMIADTFDFFDGIVISDE